MKRNRIPTFFQDPLAHRLVLGHLHKVKKSPIEQLLKNRRKDWKRSLKKLQSKDPLIGADLDYSPIGLNFGKADLAACMTGFATN